MPWINHFFAPKLEAKVINQAVKIVTSTNQLRDLLVERYPQKSKENFTSILNGYDEADFNDLPVPKSETSDRLVIVHAGGINPEFRDPIPLFKTVHDLATKGELDLDDICIRFLGPGNFAHSETMKKAVKELNLENVVEFLPRLPYQGALTELTNASVLLLLQASEDTTSLVPAKLYEYLRSQKPVLALVYPGATQEIINETSGGLSVDPRDTDAMTHTILGIYRHWSNKTLSTNVADLELLSKYNRTNLTSQLAGVFNIAVNEKNA
jgi:glycosyltransferase involved in cell wall biosynthesis